MTRDDFSLVWGSRQIDPSVGAASCDDRIHKIKETRVAKREREEEGESDCKSDPKISGLCRAKVKGPPCAYARGGRKCAWERQCLLRVDPLVMLWMHGTDAMRPTLACDQASAWLVYRSKQREGESERERHEQVTHFVRHWVVREWEGDRYNRRTSDAKCSRINCSIKLCHSRRCILLQQSNKRHWVTWRRHQTINRFEWFNLPSTIQSTSSPVHTF